MNAVWQTGVGILNIVAALITVYGISQIVIGLTSDRMDMVWGGVWESIIGGLIVTAVSLINGPISSYLANLSSLPGSGSNIPTTITPHPVSSLRSFTSSYGLVAGFITWIYAYIISTVNLVANVAIISLATFLSIANSATGITSPGTIDQLVGTIASLYGLLLNVGLGLFALFSVENFINKYKYAGSLSGTGALVVPMDLLVRYGIPLAFLNTETLMGVGGFFTRLAAGTMSSVYTSFQSVINNSGIQNNVDALGNLLKTQNIISQILVAIAMLIVIGIIIYQIASIAAIGVNVGVRLVGYIMALPIGIASFASENYQSLGINMIKGLLGTSLEGAFMVAGLAFGIITGNFLMKSLVTKNIGVLSGALTTVVVILAEVTAILAGAHAGVGLAREMFRG